MDIREEYAEKYGVKEVINDMGEHRKARKREAFCGNV